MKTRLVLRYIVLAFAVMAILLAAIWAGRMGQKQVDGAIVKFLSDTEVTFVCEVASTDAEMSLGLMHRESLDMDRGMLFVFETPGNVSFWMKNTLIPLDIIFIDESLTVLNVAQADPQPGAQDYELIKYYSTGPAKWVVEVNQGLAHAHGIVPGTLVIIDIG